MDVEIIPKCKLQEIEFMRELSGMEGILKFDENTGTLYLRMRRRRVPEINKITDEFIRTYMQKASSDFFLPVVLIHSLYYGWVKENSHTRASSRVFNYAIKRLIGAKYSVRKVSGSSVRGWVGVRLLRTSTPVTS